MKKHGLSCCKWDIDIINYDLLCDVVSFCTQNVSIRCKSIDISARGGSPIDPL